MVEPSPSSLAQSFEHDARNAESNEAGRQRADSLAGETASTTAHQDDMRADASQDSFDSGYATDNVVLQKPGRLGSRPKKGRSLKNFGSPEDDWILKRFQVLRPMLCKALNQFLRRKGLPPTCMDVCIKMLGSEEADARPTLLVSCESSLVRPINKFFLKDWVQEELRPKDWKEEPHLDFGITRMKSIMLNKTWSGARIHRRETDGVFAAAQAGERFLTERRGIWHEGTLGGAIRVRFLDEGAGHRRFLTKTYFTTAGHVLGHYDQPESSSAYFDTIHTDFDDDDAANSLSSDGEEDVDDHLIEIEADSESPIIPHQPLVMSTEYPALGPLIGKSLDFYDFAGTFEPSIDYGLVELYDADTSTWVEMPPLCPTLKDMQGRRKWHEKAIFFKARSDATATSSENDIEELQGRLDVSGSSILIPGASEFCDTVKFTCSQHRFTKGDSGTWIFSADAAYPYGQVIAADGFGDAHVLLFSDVLQDIPKSIGGVVSAILLPPIFKWHPAVIEFRQSSSAQQRQKTPTHQKRRDYPAQADFGNRILPPAFPAPELSGQTLASSFGSNFAASPPTYFKAAMERHLPKIWYPDTASAETRESYLPTISQSYWVPMEPETYKVENVQWHPEYGGKSYPGEEALVKDRRVLGEPNTRTAPHNQETEGVGGKGIEEGGLELFMPPYKAW